MNIVAQMPELRKARPADWGVGMTVCLGSIANYGNAIILLSDTMVSTDSYTEDSVALKLRSLAPRWAATFAGNELSHISPILKLVKDRCLENPDASTKDIVAAFEEAFAIELRRKIEGHFLSSLQYTLPQFKKLGLAQLGETTFNSLLYQIQEAHISLTFLVGGFDQDGPQLFTATSKGIEYHDSVGFWAIGSGELAALGTLFNSGHSALTDTPTAFYRLCEAKFVAETAPGVGRVTLANIIKRDGSDQQFLGGNNLDDIRQIWEANRQKNIPPGAWDAAKKALTPEVATPSASQK